LPRSTRLRAYLVAATAVAFLIGVGPAAPAAAAATPTSSTAPEASPPVTAADPTTTVAPLASTVAAPSPAATASTPEPILATVAALTTTPARATVPKAALVIAIAKTKLGRPWVYGAAGPSMFDCSGLVIYAFRMAGIARIVGSSHEVSAFALYARFKSLGLASQANGRPGDLVIWGGGAHVGIYLGNGMAISALVTGVRIHGIRALTTPFTAFLHTGIAQATSAVTRTAKPTAVAAKDATVTARRVTTTPLRLRSSSSTAGRVLSTLAARTVVGVVGAAKDGAGRTWYRVRVGGRMGWLAGWCTRSI
jgi:cell wall-associated NlpC family hydrolase